MSSVNQIPVAPAGWYPDPLGIPQVRWWNGIGWTNRIEDLRPEIHVSGGGEPASHHRHLVGIAG